MASSKRDKALLAEITGVARRLARGQQLSEAEQQEAAATLSQVAGGRPQPDPALGRRRPPPGGQQSLPAIPVTACRRAGKGPPAACPRPSGSPPSAPRPPCHTRRRRRRPCPPRT